MLTFRLLPAALLVFSAACSPSDTDENREANAALQAGVTAEPALPAAPATPAAAATPATPATAATPAAAATPASSGETVGGDGSAIALSAVRAGDGAELKGELACTFAAGAKAEPILLAWANVGRRERGSAVVRNGTVIETLVMRSEGGFGAMEKGTTFGGKGLTIRIEGQAKAGTGDESTAQHATLLVQRADGAERRYSGMWTCGP